jgi:hypothetical protein
MLTTTIRNCHSVDVATRSTPSSCTLTTRTEEIVIFSIMAFLIWRFGRGTFVSGIELVATITAALEG